MHLPSVKERTQSEYNDEQFTELGAVRTELQIWKRSFWILSAVFAATLIAMMVEILVIRKMIETGRIKPGGDMLWLEI